MMACCELRRYKYIIKARGWTADVTARQPMFAPRDAPVGRDFAGEAAFELICSLRSETGACLTSTSLRCAARSSRAASRAAPTSEAFLADFSCFARRCCRRNSRSCLCDGYKNHDEFFHIHELRPTAEARLADFSCFARR